jgi:hypothetical protein
MVSGSACGTARLTPRDPHPLFGRGAGVSVGIFSELEANIIALRGRSGLVLLIGLDTLFSSHHLREAVTDLLSADERSRIEDIVFVASHTHNAPALDPTKPVLGRMSESYLAEVASALAQMVSRRLVEASADIADITRGKATCGLNAMRRRRWLRLTARRPFAQLAMNMLPVHQAQTPRDLEIIIGRSAAGTPQWAIWSWPCHATAAPDPLQISADFPGHVRTILRARLSAPHLPVIFLPGFCGDMRPDASVLPVSLAQLARNPLHRPFARATPANFARLCAALTATVDSALEAFETQPAPTAAHVARDEVALTALIEATEQPAIAAMEIVAIDAGSLGLLFLGAEVCSSYLEKIASVTPRHWLRSGYADDVFGYLPTDRQIAEGGYEAADFFFPFGLSGRFKPRIEGSVVDAVVCAVQRARSTP